MTNKITKNELHADLVEDIGKIDGLEQSVSDLNQNVSGVSQDVSDLSQDVSEHLADKANPHNVTAEQVGLSNVDNVKQIPLSQKGAPNGVAQLDSNGNIPEEQIQGVALTYMFLNLW